MEKNNNKQSVVHKVEQVIARFSEQSGISKSHASIVYFMTYLFIAPLILACYTIFSVIMQVSFKQFFVIVLTMGLLFVFVVMHHKFYPKQAIEKVLLFFLLFHFGIVALLPPIIAVFSTLL